MFVFDFDGVIADTLESYQHVCQKAAVICGSDTELDKNPFAELDPVTFEALGEKLAINGNRYAAVVASEMCAYPDIPKLFEGMTETLALLSERIPLAVLSASHSDVLNKILTFHGIDKYFASIIGGDIAGSKSEKLIKIKSQYTPHIIMVGDSVSDMDAAKKAKVKSIAVSWGWQKKQKLAGRQPDYIINSPKDLLSVMIEL